MAESTECGRFVVRLGVATLLAEADGLLITAA